MFLDKMKAIKDKLLKEEKSVKRNIWEAFAQNDINIIAEIKKASPSKGDICLSADITDIAGQYINNGATAISVLTETEYFKGDLEYLKRVRNAYPNAILLRKDFIIDAYQIYEAKFASADMILLIMALTGFEKTEELLKIAHEIGLEALIEIHTEEEMQQALKLDAKFIGVNNRNLQTLEVSLDTSRQLSKYIDKSRFFVCESGLTNSKELKEMVKLGYKGFLMGSHLMESENSGEELKKLLQETKDNG
jgi:indole-3-glycerol phosphate synthase